MPEPTSSSSSPRPNSSFAPDPTLDEAGQICRSDATSSSATPPAAATSEAPPKPLGVTKLMSAAPPRASVLPPPAQAQNNAQRTSEMNRIATRYFDAGVTGGARDALYVGGAAIKGRDSATGLELEMFSVSAQVGGEHEAQLGMARVGVSGSNGNVTGEAFTVRANGGAHNDDGSVGFNAGVIGTAVGVEGTLGSRDSLTLGASIGAGAAVSVGVRDLDANGVPEFCAKVSVGFLTAGICWEQAL